MGGAQLLADRIPASPGRLVGVHGRSWAESVDDAPADRGEV